MLQSMMLLLVFALVSLLVVKYNTVVHPFTLADNRHYMFYVFRYTILRPGWTRYYLVVAYTLCSYMCFVALSGTCWPGGGMAAAPPAESALFIQTPFDSHENWCGPVSRPALEVGEVSTTTATTTTTDSNRNHQPPPHFPDKGHLPSTDLTQHTDTVSEHLPPDPGSRSTAAPTSAAILLLLATSLSLVTAPLVEPRYFILPWVFWRLLIAIPDTAPPPPPGPQVPVPPVLAWLARVGHSVEARLWLETTWFLLVNAATMAVFVARPFHWRAADGSLLDDGRAQRFMW